MLILADRDIAAVEETFSTLGELRPFTARTLTRDDVRDADVLLVRSTTRVDAALLAGSRVRFVGSATAGTDHVDENWLKDHGIVLASAPGSNADAVVDYVTAALLELAAAGCWDLKGRTLGIIGAGNVGSKLMVRARQLGMDVLANDPPLAERGGRADLHSVEAIFATADAVSVHVPLTTTGHWPTRDMVDASWLARLKHGSWFINTSRGEVVDEVALIDTIGSGRIAASAIDVWRNEPAVNAELADVVDIATPHIAGYSAAARLAGTRMIRAALCNWLGVVDIAPISTHQPLVPATFDLAEIRKILDLPLLTRRLRASLRDSSQPTFDAQRRAQQQRGSLSPG